LIQNSKKSHHKSGLGYEDKTYKEIQTKYHAPSSRLSTGTLSNDILKMEPLKNTNRK